MENNNVLVTVKTCTFNRAHTLPDVYQSLCEQTFKNFEWIIVDDGSTDNTKQIVDNWLAENKIQIRYFYQQNNGKHIATNLAVSVARGKYLVNIDSDDVMKKDALEIFLKAWESIPEEERDSYMSVKARCYDPATGMSIGKEIPKRRLVCSYLDAKYKFKIDFEMWSMVKTDVLRQYPNPDIRGGKNGGGLRFYPEGIWQDLAARKYVTLFINDTLRGYNCDTSTSLMGRGAKYDRSRENIHLWTHVLNDNLDYFWSAPKSFIKASVGVSMDCYFLKIKKRQMFKMLNGFFRKLFVALFIPVGYFCYKKRL